MKRWYSPRTTTKRKLAPATYISKADAEAKRLLTYWDGTICGSGHLSSRYVFNDKCLECERKKDRRRFRSGIASRETK